jgi:hypothetical protein
MTDVPEDGLTSVRPTILTRIGQLHWNRAQGDLWGLHKAHEYRKPLLQLARPEGFEPPTLRFEA